jgi:hypothetical protein
LVKIEDGKISANTETILSFLPRGKKDATLFEADAAVED